MYKPRKRFEASHDEADSKDNEVDTRRFLKESHSLMMGALSGKVSSQNFGIKTSDG